MLRIVWKPEGLLLRVIIDGPAVVFSKFHYVCSELIWCVDVVPCWVMCIEISRYEGDFCRWYDVVEMLFIHVTQFCGWNVYAGHNYLSMRVCYGGRDMFYLGRCFSMLDGAVIYSFSD